MSQPNSIASFKMLLDNRSQFDIEKMWPFADEWAKQRNDNCEDLTELEWSWDCGLKLDYDGSILKVLSRFYPPHKSHADYGLYHGDVDFYIVGVKIFSKSFEAKTLDVLCNQVETYVLQRQHQIADFIENNLDSIFH